MIFTHIIKQTFDLIMAEYNQDKQLEIFTPKKRILQSAVYLFAKQGFDGTGLRELATRAEVNLAMINYFFGSKKGLLKEILDNFFEGYLAIARKELVGTETLHIKLRRFINSSVRYFDSGQDALLVTITELSHDDPDIIEHKATWARQMAEVLEKEVCQPLKEETGKSIPATCIGPMLTSLMASRFLFAPVLTRVRRESGNPVDIHAYTEMITSLFLQGIATENTTPKQET